MSEAKRDGGERWGRARGRRGVGEKVERGCEGAIDKKGRKLSKFTIDISEVKRPLRLNSNSVDSGVPRVRLINRPLRWHGEDFEIRGTKHRTICVASEMTQIERKSIRRDERIKKRKRENGRQLQRGMRNAAMLQSPLQISHETGNVINLIESIHTLAYPSSV